MNIFIKTLGCKSNRADSDKLIEKLVKEYGHNICIYEDILPKAGESFEGGVDVCVIATCTVTHVADRKSRSSVSMLRRRFPMAKVVIIGCGPRVDKTIYEAIGADCVGLSVEEAFEYVCGLGNEDNGLSCETRGCVAASMNEEPESYRPVKGERTRSVLKIQDGCNNFCTYCIIPFARGREKSVKASEVLLDVERKIEAGYKELVLTGINIGNWTDESEGVSMNLGALIIKILDETSLPRLRLSSIEPQNFGEEFETLLTDDRYRERFCPHLHMSLQSGSDQVLSMMHRNYDSKLYKKVAQEMVKLRPELALTTDVIVGFPGETDKDFEESYCFVEKIGFSKVHVFPYSKRAGTKAALMDGQVTDQVKKARAKRLQALSDKLMHDFYERNLGKTFPVLFEQQVRKSAELVDNDVVNEIWEGFTPNYIKVEVTMTGDSSGKDLFNQIVDVKLEGLSEGSGNKKAPIVRGQLV